jgi:hypothetical protein
MNRVDENYTEIQPSASSTDSVLRLIFLQVAKQLSAFYVTLNFFTVFTKTSCQFLPWGTYIRPTSKPVYALALLVDPPPSFTFSN